MFTGIVEELGEIVRVDAVDGGTRLTVRAATVLDGTRRGDSIAVDGVCLTVTTLSGGDFAADVMPETLRRSTLDAVAPGRAVNLERAATPTTRLGGHLVQGHVDGVGEVVARTPDAEWDTLSVAVPEQLVGYLAEKGSVAVDGVSLTITAVEGNRFSVGLIPTTLAATTLGRRREGDRVNVEVDVVAKYVERLLAARPVAEPSS